MFTILVKIEDKTGNYPVVYLTAAKSGGLSQWTYRGEYVVSDKECDKGSAMTAEVIAEEIPKLLGLKNIKTVEIKYL